MILGRDLRHLHRPSVLALRAPSLGTSRSMPVTALAWNQREERKRACLEFLIVWINANFLDLVGFFGAQGSHIAARQEGGNAGNQHSTWTKPPCFILDRKAMMPSMFPSNTIRESRKNISRSHNQAVPTEESTRCLIHRLNWVCY